jgi:hypothetical protein
MRRSRLGDRHDLAFGQRRRVGARPGRRPSHCATLNTVKRLRNGTARHRRPPRAPASLLALRGEAVGIDHAGRARPCGRSRPLPALAGRSAMIARGSPPDDRAPQDQDIDPRIAAARSARCAAGRDPPRRPAPHGCTHGTRPASSSAMIRRSPRHRDWCARSAGASRFTLSLVGDGSAVLAHGLLLPPKNRMASPERRGVGGDLRPEEARLQRTAAPKGAAQRAGTQWNGAP